jgi:hypothetical protein
MTKRSLALTIAALLAGTAAVVGWSAAPSAAAKRPPLHWAAADSAQIHPGTQMYSAGGQCTANFVFRDRARRVYVGYAAHCAGKGEATDTDGCHVESLPLGTRVTFSRDGNPSGEGTRIGGGRLAYSSWRTMQRLGESDPVTCAYNDLALVRVSAADVAKVNPSVPFWGGPTGIDTDGTAAGDRVWTYGNSSLRFGIEALAPHTGVSLGDSAADGGWSHPLYTVTPGVPGDSGSAFLSAGGKAVGVLSTLGLAPLPASNNIGDLGKELAYARQHAGIRGLRLVKGTEPFAPLF